MDIEHVDTIVDMRRYEVLMESRFPRRGRAHAAQHREPGRSLGAGRGPSGRSGPRSLDFEVPVITGTIPDEIEYLYWVGCAGALDERARKATQATARLLHRAGVTFGILGPRESCTGDPARRLGQRVPLPGDGEGQHRHAQRGGGQEGGGLVPALLQLAVAGVPRPGGQLRGDPPLDAAQPPDRDGQAHARAPSTPRSPTTTPATWAGTTGSSTSPGRCSTRSPGSSRSR